MPQKEGPKNLSSAVRPKLAQGQPQGQHLHSTWTMSLILNEIGTDGRIVLDRE